MKHITNRKTRDIIFSGEFNNDKECLENAIKNDINLSYSNLNNINLLGINLNGVDLSYSNLSCTNLRHANLSNTNLNNCNLSCSDLRNTNLIKADLSNATLHNANVNNACLDHCILNDVEYNILSLLKINWGQLSDELTLELMRHENEFYDYEIYKDKTEKDYNKINYCLKRNFNFQDKLKFWKSGIPTLRGFDLFIALCNDKNIKINPYSKF